MTKNKNYFQNKFIKIGHRGACGYETENTLPSFGKAIVLGADAVEFDVRLCKSGEAVVFHDDSLKRLAGLNEKISDKTLTELKAISIGGGEKIPTLEEVLDFINGRIGVNIEIKDEGAILPTTEIIENFTKKEKWRENDFLISSFDFDWLEKFRKIMPEIKIGALIEDIPIDYERITKRLKAFSVNPPFSLIDDSLVEQAHGLGLKIVPFTVNESSDIIRLKELGVDGIFSDFPDRL